MSAKLSMCLGFAFLLPVLAGCSHAAAPASSPTAARPVVDFAIAGDARVQRASTGRAEQTASAPPMRMELWSQPAREAAASLARTDDAGRRTRAHRDY